MYLLYVLKGCPYCEAAIKHLKTKGLTHKTIIVHPNDKDEIMKQNKMRTFPQIFKLIKGKYTLVGGYSELIKSKI